MPGLFELFRWNSGVEYNHDHSAAYNRGAVKNIRNLLIFASAGCLTLGALNMADASSNGEDVLNFKSTLEISASITLLGVAAVLEPITELMYHGMQKVLPQY